MFNKSTWLKQLLWTVTQGTFVQSYLAFTTLWANSAARKLMEVFLFFPENIGDNLHEMSNPVSFEKKQKNKM